MFSWNGTVGRHQSASEIDGQTWLRPKESESQHQRTFDTRDVEGNRSSSRTEGMSQKRAKSAAVIIISTSTRIQQSSQAGKSCIVDQIKNPYPRSSVFKPAGSLSCFRVFFQMSWSGSEAAGSPHSSPPRSSMTQRTLFFHCVWWLTSLLSSLTLVSSGSLGQNWISAATVPWRFPQSVELLWCYLIKLTLEWGSKLWSHSGCQTNRDKAV